jgi:predicted nucleotidyltransferase
MMSAVTEMLRAYTCERTIPGLPFIAVDHASDTIVMIVRDLHRARDRAHASRADAHAHGLAACSWRRARTPRYTRHMPTLEDYLQALRGHETDLRAHGIRHAAVVGCVPHGEEEPDEGCLGVLADFDPRRYPTDFDIAAAEEYLERLLGCRVELDSFASMRSEKGDAVPREAVNAF